MTSEGLVEMFEDHFADTCDEKFAGVDGEPSGALVCAEMGARTPIGTSGNLGIVIVTTLISIMTISYVILANCRTKFVYSKH